MCCIKQDIQRYKAQSLDIRVPEAQIQYSAKGICIKVHLTTIFFRSISAKVFLGLVGVSIFFPLPESYPLCCTTEYYRAWVERGRRQGRGVGWWGNDVFDHRHRSGCNGTNWR